jgi:ABC-type branched-subunit amino acid transport system permease subunit
LIAFAGVAPDLDGLGIIGEYVTRNSTRPLTWYSDYHHVLGHTIGFALLVAAMTYGLSRRRSLAAWLAFASFNLHLLFDLAGSRGADGYQWPIPYLWPFSSAWQLTWTGQWLLSAWQNTAITVVLVLATATLAWRLGYSPVGLLSRRGDESFVRALRARFGEPGRGMV